MEDSSYWVELILTKVNDREAAKMATFACMLWKARNERLWNQDSKGPWLIKLKVETWIEASWEANIRQRMDQQQQPHNNKHNNYHPSFYKVNVRCHLQ